MTIRPKFILNRRLFFLRHATLQAEDSQMIWQATSGKHIPRCWQSLRKLSAWFDSTEKVSHLGTEKGIKCVQLKMVQGCCSCNCSVWRERDLLFTTMQHWSCWGWGGGGESGPLYAVTTPEMTYERSLAMNHLGLKSTSATWIPRTPLLPILLQRQY